MKAKKSTLVVSTVLSALFMIIAGCESTNSLESPASQTEAAIADIRNIVWTLNRAHKNNEDIDLRHLPPFRLLFNDSLFFGDDGCNLYGGRYVSNNDSIFPHDLGQTERLCLQATFPVDHLAEPFRLEIAPARLRVKRSNDVYTYESDFTLKIADTPIIGNWILESSTDADFSEIERQQLIPMLSFTSNREFKIVWFCQPDNIFDCNELSGIFGIGRAGRILFYRGGSKVSGSQGLAFMGRILDSSVFTIAPDVSNGGRLTLVNEGNNTNFKFTLASRSAQ